jgi:nicotinamidase-related amidase
VKAALLLVDFINDFEFDGGDRLFPRALEAAKASAALKRRAKAAGVPVVYCNDNFGRWRSDFRALLERCLKEPVRGRPVAELLRPAEDDYFVLKPKHSGFHSSALDVLLKHLEVDTLVLTGVAGDYCVLFTAQDAYMRGYRLLVPRDCTASHPDEDNRRALAHLEKTCKADTGPSEGIGF